MAGTIWLSVPQSKHLSGSYFYHHRYKSSHASRWQQQTNGMQAAGHGSRSPTKSTALVVPINAGNRALRTPAFQASPGGVAAETGLASRYAKLVPTSKPNSSSPPVKRQVEEEEPSEQQANAALARCQHYVTAGIDDKHVTPFPQDWAVNAVSMLPPHDR